MDDDSLNPFDSLESSYQYVCLLHQALGDACETIEGELAHARTDGAHRRLEALQLVDYKLHQLDRHLSGARRILNDLRALRRILFGERRSVPGEGREAGSAPDGSSGIEVSRRGSM